MQDHPPEELTVQSVLASIVPTAYAPDKVHPACQWMFLCRDEGKAGAKFRAALDEWSPGMSLLDTVYQGGDRAGKYISFDPDHEWAEYEGDDDEQEHTGPPHIQLWDADAFSNYLRSSQYVYESVKEHGADEWGMFTRRQLMECIDSEIEKWAGETYVDCSLTLATKIRNSLMLARNEIAIWCCCDYCISPDLWMHAATGQAVDIWSEKFKQEVANEAKPERSIFMRKKRDRTPEEIARIKQESMISHTIAALKRRGALGEEQ